MNIDRRKHDPYAPASSTESVDPLIVDTAKTPTVGNEPDIEDMSKAELIEYAYRFRLPIYGTKADLVARIVSARTAT